MNKTRSEGEPRGPFARGTLPSTLSGDALNRGARLYGDAVLGQMRQWQRVFAKVASGSYGPQDVTADLQESTRRAVGLWTELAGLWWNAGSGATGGFDLYRWLPGGATERSGTPGPQASTRPADPQPAPAAAAPVRRRTAKKPVQASRASAPAQPRSKPAAAATPQAAAPPRPTRAARKPAAAAKPTARARADQFLRDLLADGPKPAREVLELAAKAGISKTTLQRAKRGLGIESARTGFGPQSRVVWELP